MRKFGRLKVLSGPTVALDDSETPTLDNVEEPTLELLMALAGDSPVCEAKTTPADDRFVNMVKSSSVHCPSAAGDVEIDGNRAQEEDVEIANTIEDCLDIPVSDAETIPADDVEIANFLNTIGDCLDTVPANAVEIECALQDCWVQFVFDSLIPHHMARYGRKMALRGHVLSGHSKHGHARPP